MATLENSLKSINQGLSILNSFNGKYVTVADSDGTLSGRIRPNMFVFGDDLVDMGLPSGTLWAKKNIGALTETGYGWYFSWGNLEAHQEGAGYNFSQDVYNATPAAAIEANLTLEQDAAHANLGSLWRMPTTEEFAELFNSSYTTNAWTTINGVNGRLVTSKANGNRLFFPAAGLYDGTSLDYRGSYGYYWSSSWVSSTNARNLFFYSSGVDPQGSDNRRCGFSVRAVQN